VGQSCPTRTPRGHPVPGKSNKLVFTRADIIADCEAVTIREAANYLGVSHKTIRRRISDGTLPAFRVAGGPIRVLAKDVEALKTPVRPS
jgi:excisionase family DNA binding protein